jgi:cytoskeletal protein RodZ
MKSQLRLRYVLPLVVVAAGGLAVFKLGVLGNDGKAEATPSPAHHDTTASASTTPADTGPAETGSTTTTQPAEGSTTSSDTDKGPTGSDRLATVLKKDAVVVVVVYSPVGAVDKLEVAEARLGADDANAGFLALDASKETAIADFAETYDVRLTPTVLVFRRGPNLAKKFIEFADRDTVAQAAQDARHTS